MAVHASLSHLLKGALFAEGLLLEALDLPRQLGDLLLLLLLQGVLQLDLLLPQLRGVRGWRVEV